MQPCRSLAAAALAVLSACAAQQPPSPAAATPDPARAAPAPTLGTLERGQGPRRLAQPVAASPEENAGLIARNPGVARFLANEGKGWTVTFDRRSGQPMLYEGPGIPFLSESSAGLRERPSDEASVAARAAQTAGEAETSARALLSRNAGLVELPAQELALDRSWTGSPDGGGDLFLATFRASSGGVLRDDARVTFVIKMGNLIQIHAERMHRANVPLEPAVTENDAFESLTRAGLHVTPRNFQSDLKLVNLDAGEEAPGVYGGTIGAGYEQHLAWAFRFQLPNDFRTIVAWVDAHTGELLELFDDNKYGSVVGGIFPRTVTDGEKSVPFGNTKVDAAGTAVTTDMGGHFAYSSGIASSALGGANINISDKCGAVNASVSGGTGAIDLGTSAGADCSFSATGYSTRAARNAFYHLNNVRLIGKKWLAGVNATATSWIGKNMGANVNINDKCNAYWDGSTVNFFRSGSGCNNTGEISDVMQHEWGHGLDQNTKGGSVGDSAKGEAIADTVALLMTHDRCVGPGFFQTGGGETAECKTSVRDFGFEVTQQNIGSKCQKSLQCKGALGYECHCESHLLSGAMWTLAQKFVSRYGDADGWAKFEKTFLRALPNITAYMPATAGNAYSALLAADDDNANVADGTPNADIIFDAFSSRGLAGAQVAANATRCTAAAGSFTGLPAVADVKATAQAGAIDLAWSAVKGATSYSVLRNLQGGGSKAYLPLAEGLAEAKYLDTQVAAGHTFSYVVVAMMGDCPTPYGTPASAAPLAATPGTGTDDFSVMAQPAGVQVAPGQSATVRITTAVTSGAAQSVALSLSGLPANVTATFNPTTVQAGGTATLTISAASNAANGSTNLTIRGTGKVAHDIAARVTVATATGGGGSSCPPGTTDVFGVCIPKCSSASTGPAWLALLGLLGLMRRRRK